MPQGPTIIENPSPEEKEHLELRNIRREIIKYLSGFIQVQSFALIALGAKQKQSGVPCLIL